MNKNTTYQLLKKITEDKYKNIFINWCTDNFCKRMYCDIGCNLSLINNLIGCYVQNHSERESYTTLNAIKQRIDAGYYWEEEWKKEK